MILTAISKFIDHENVNDYQSGKKLFDQFSDSLLIHFNAVKYRSFHSQSFIQTNPWERFTPRFRAWLPGEHHLLCLPEPACGALCVRRAGKQSQGVEQTPAKQAQGVRHGGASTYICIFSAHVIKYQWYLIKKKDQSVL